MFTAVLVTAAATSEPSADLSGLAALLAPVLLTVVAFFARRIQQKRLAQAVELLARVAVKGVTVAWETYTEGRKRLSADGKLTPEEASEARRLAFKAALESAGADGKKLLESAFRDGLDAALANAIASEYAAFRQSGPVVDPSAPSGQ